MADLKVLCEIRGDKGEAWFDLDSIKLSRSAGAPKKATSRQQASR